MPVRQILGALRMGLAIAVALFISIFLRLENPYWAPTTIIIVEAINFGSFAGKIIPRFLGNFCGTICSIIFLSYFSQTDLIFAVAMSAIITAGAYLMFRGIHPLFWRWGIISFCLACGLNINNPVASFYLGMDRIAGVAIGLFINLVFHLYFFHRSAEKDYQTKVVQILKVMSDLVAERSNQIKTNTLAPLIDLKYFIPMVSELKEDFTAASRDSVIIALKKKKHNLLIDHLETLIHQLNTVLIDPPDMEDHQDFYNVYVKKMDRLSYNLEALQSEFSGLKTDSKIEEIQETITDSTNQFDTLISKSLRTTVGLKRLTDAFEKKEFRKTVPPMNIDTMESNYSMLLNHLENGYKAFLLGLSTFLGMMLWRETGWPGGYVVPLLGMVQVMFCIMNPSLTLSFLCVLQCISLIIASLIAFFILPGIYSTEFFFMFIVVLFFFFGLLIHSSNRSLRGIGLMSSVLVNSCVYAYRPSSHAFIISLTYAWGMIGGILIAMIILMFLYPEKIKLKIKRFKYGIIKLHQRLSHVN